jgi:hypothetical protein
VYNFASPFGFVLFDMDGLSLSHMHVEMDKRSSMRMKMDKWEVGGHICSRLSELVRLSKS